MSRTRSPLFEPCAFQAPHHSDDKVTVHYGRTEPALLCGFHASAALLDTVLSRLHAPPLTATPPPIPNGPYAPFDPDAEPVCIHCGTPIVRNYDGPGTGWSHIHGDTRDGIAQCFREAS